MAIIFVDGFPYDTASWRTGLQWNEYDPTEPNSISTGGRFNARFAWLKGIASGSVGQTYMWRTLPSNYATLFYQFAYIPFDYVNWPWIIVFGDGGTQQVGISDEQGVLKAYRGGSNLLGTASAPISQATWHQIEVAVTISSSAGSVLVKVDGATLINVSGANTQSTGNAYINRVTHGTTKSGASSGNGMGISDVICMDATQVGGQDYCNHLLGPRTVSLCVPTADGNYSQWTKSTGASNFGNIDEIPPNGDADYNSSSTVGQIDTFVIPDIGVDATVDAVVCSIYARQGAAGNMTMQGVARSNNQDGLGTEIVVPASYNWGQSIIYVDPNTGQPFTAAGFNSAEFGYKKAS